MYSDIQLLQKGTGNARVMYRLVEGISIHVSQLQELMLQVQGGSQLQNEFI